MPRRKCPVTVFTVLQGSTHFHMNEREDGLAWALGILCGNNVICFTVGFAVAVWGHQL